MPSFTQNADSNDVTVLPDSLFNETPKLRQFSMFFNFNLAALPEELFQSGGVAKTPDLDRIVLYATAIKKIEPMTFAGLAKLRILTFVNNQGFGEANFDSVYWDDLVSLEHFVSSIVRV